MSDHPRLRQPAPSWAAGLSAVRLVVGQTIGADPSSGGFGPVPTGHLRGMGPTDATRTALAMIRADWQGDDETWAQLWTAADDHAAVVRELTRLCRQNL